MTNLPRRPIEPLEPPPDSFNRVLGEARRVRRRRGLVAASAMSVLAMVAAGSFALGASLKVTHEIDPADHKTPAPQTSGSSRSHPAKSAGSHNGHSQSASTKKSVAASSWLSGRAVDATGTGIANLFVLAGLPGRSFSSDGRVAGVTDASGYFRIHCPHAPVLLSTWQLNRDYYVADVGAQWAATFVGDAGGHSIPKCDGPSYTTTLAQGATVTGRIVESGPCVPGDRYDLWLWLGGNRSNAIRLHGLDDAVGYRISGLPPGTHIIGVRHQIRSVLVTAGAAVDGNAYYACNGTTTGSGATIEQSIPPATPTPTPDPTPSGSTQAVN
jgi:hypothetical protein